MMLKIFYFAGIQFKKMSLFQAREWWTTWCGAADEEFDQGNLCIANIDNSQNGFG